MLLSIRDEGQARSGKTYSQGAHDSLSISVPALPPLLGGEAVAPERTHPHQARKEQSGGRKQEQREYEQEEHRKSWRCGREHSWRRSVDMTGFSSW